jgi:hypothetical protein
MNYSDNFRFTVDDLNIRQQILEEALTAYLEGLELEFYGICHFVRQYADLNEYVSNDFGDYHTPSHIFYWLYQEFDCDLCLLGSGRIPEREIAVALILKFIKRQDVKLQFNYDYLQFFYECHTEEAEKELKVIRARLLEFQRNGIKKLKKTEG